MSKYSVLEGVAKAIGGECWKQFQKLAEEAAFAETIRQAVIKTHVGTPAVAGPAEETVEASAKPAKKQHKKSRKRKTAEKTKPMSEHGNVAVQIDLLLSKAKGPKAYAGAKRRAIKALGLSGRKFSRNRHLKVGANFTQTIGSRRGNFFRRVQASGVTLDVLKEIAAAYGKLDYPPVTVEDLKVEANKAAG